MNTNAPAWTFDGVVRFTPVGTSYLAFTLVIGFAALNTGNNALYIALAFMFGCLLLSGVASKGGLEHLSVEVRGVDEVWAGKPAQCILRVSNRSRLWNVRDVVISAAELANPVLVPMVRRRDATDIDASLLFQRRGVVQLTRMDLYTRYPFGFFLKKRRARLSGEVVVFPRLVTDSSSRPRFRPVIGEQVTAGRPGPGTEIHSFRDYVRGDSLRHVYWKKSASLGRWIMKQTEMDASRVVHVVVDPYKPGTVSDEAFEDLVSAAATFIHQATGAGLTVILSLPRATFHATDAATARAMFRALALLEASHEAVDQVTERESLVFSLRRADARPAA